MADITEKTKVSLEMKIFISMCIFFIVCSFVLGDLYGKVKSLPEKVEKLEESYKKKKTRDQQMCRVLQKIQYSTVPKWYQEDMKCDGED